MSNETKLAGQQAAAGVDILEQPERTEDGTRRSHRTSKPEPAALTERGQIVNAETYWVGLALD